MVLTAVNYTSRPPKEEDLKVIARMVDGGPEVLLRDNSWPRIVNPDEIAAPIFFLSSDDASYLTGVNLPVDGGWTAT